MSSEYVLNTWEEVFEAFQLSHLERKVLEGCRLLIAAADEGGYEGDIFVLYVTPDGKLCEVNSSHCSCDGYTWEAEETNLAYYWRWFVDVASGKARGNGVKFLCYNDIVMAINKYTKEGASA